MTRPHLLVVVAAFVVGTALGLSPLLLIAGTDRSEAAGAQEGAGAGPTATGGTATPSTGVDPDSTATASPESVDVPRVGDGDSDSSSGSGSSGSGSSGGSSGGSGTSGSSGGSGSAGADVTDDSASVCADPTVKVSDAASLASALASAKAGDVIAMSDGTYEGGITMTTSGTSSAPIYLCGSSDAVLRGDGYRDGYGVHLDGAEQWRLVGFTVENFQKGVVADGTVGSVIEGLTVHGTGDEAIHLRSFSTDNTVTGNVVYDTGNRREKFGEGVYVGSAESNWCNYSDCGPDRSDRNLVVGNTIYDTTAEAVDIKEGTTGGVLRGNSFDGSSLYEPDADSWVDVKGNDWLIVDNTGVNSPMDGFQVHKILDGWGKGNVFRSNSATVAGEGFGFSLTPVQDNVVECSNTVSQAEEGYANVSCE